MNLVDKMKKILNSNTNKKDKLQKSVNAVKNVYDESDSKKEATQNAINRVIEVIQAHPDMPVGEFLKMIQDETELSDKSLVEIIKQIPDVKSEEATIDAVQKVDLASEAIAEIIQDASVSPVTAQKIAEQIPDKDIQQQQQVEIEKMLQEEQRQATLAKEKELLSNLTKIYNTCEEISDNELVEEIDDLEITTRTEKIDNLLEHIIAKKMALDCMQFGGPKIPTMMRIMPAVDMLEANLPLLIEEEYQKIKVEYDEQGKEYHEYDKREKQMVKIKLLENIAKKVARDFKELGNINVPQIDQLRNLSEVESNIFITTIRTSCHEEQLNEDDVEMIQRQLNGTAIDEWKNLNRILKKMKPKDREIAIRDFMKLLKFNETKTHSQKELDESIANIGIEIKKLPTDKQLSTAKTILSTLKQQQNAIAMWKNHKKANEITSEDMQSSVKETPKEETR